MAAKSTSLTRARAAKKKAIEQLEGVADVNGVGITRVGDGYGLKVNLASTPKRWGAFPAAVDGVPVTVEVVGPIRPRPVS
ncbi:hypothetical protein BH18ACT12_BH18ACT12_16930 [soil metagenome]